MRPQVCSKRVSLSSAIIPNFMETFQTETNHEGKEWSAGPIVPFLLSLPVHIMHTTVAGSDESCGGGLGMGLTG